MSTRRLGLSFALALATLAAPMPVWANTAAAPVGAMSLRGGVFDRTISVSISNMPLQDAIRLVAQKGRLNIVIEDDLKAVVNVEFRDVKLGDALDALFTMGGVQAFWRGNVFAVVGRKNAFERGLLSQNAKVFKLRYASAARIAEFLNSTALTRPYQEQMNSSSQGGQNQLELAKADPRTNTVLVLGTPSDLALAERAIAVLDQPMKQKIFKLNHANAVQVASLLNATVFNIGNKASVSENVRVDVETIAENAQAGTMRAGVELTDTQANIRTHTLQTQNLPVEARYATAVPDSRTNSVIVVGSQETLGLAAELIPQLDRRPRQVSIEVQVVEMTTQDALELGTMLTGAQGPLSSTFDPAAASPGWTVFFDPTANATPAFKVRLNALLKAQKAKLLAHPTVLATENTESQINIVDEVIKGTRITNQGLTVGNQSLLIVEPIYGAAGVTLNILPKIGEDNTVSLRLHPTVSSVRETLKDAANNTISLLSRRELVAQQVVVPSGASLTLGGLTQTTMLESRTKFPILGDIPILGHLFGSTATQSRQTELMIIVTPKVLEQ